MNSPPLADLLTAASNGDGEAQEALLVDERVEAGSHTADFEAGSLPSGAYLVRLTTDGGFAETQRLTLLC